jgi:hypothetical protein
VTRRLVPAQHDSIGAGELDGGRQRNFTINWIQLAVTCAAFALFILALSFL